MRRSPSIRQLPAIPVDLLPMLRCPESGQTLEVASADLLAGVNVGRSETIVAGLVRADGKLLYPIRENLPVLLVEEAIPI